MGGVSRVAVSEAFVAVSRDAVVKIVGIDAQASSKPFTLPHGGVVRDMTFITNGLLTAGDDKILRLFSQDTWDCTSSCELPKKITVICAMGANTVIACTKAGDVYSVPLSSDGQLGTPDLLYGHYSLVTAAAPAADGSFLCTADRDEKIRVTRPPNYVEISAFCLGHTELVSALSPVPTRPALCVSGGGDRTVRVWDALSGRQIASAHLSREGIVEQLCPPAAETVEQYPTRGNDDVAVVGLACSHDTVFVALEGVPHITALAMSGDPPTLALSHSRTLATPAPVTDLRVAGGRVWAACCTGELCVFALATLAPLPDLVPAGALSDLTAAVSTEQAIPEEYRRKFNDEIDVQGMVQDRISHKKHKAAAS